MQGIRRGLLRFSFFLPLAGLIVFSRWHYRWILSFSTLMSAVFVGINLFKPEIHSKTLMPALQSAWFAPHVIVYMISYALLCAYVWVLATAYCMYARLFPVPMAGSLFPTSTSATAGRR